jgi:xylan 1,4-beta-xylosidase
MKSPVFFNAHHSPVGAFASFTLGMKGSRGGFGLELTGPANEAVYIGIEDVSTPGKYQTLPFYGETTSAAADYDVEGNNDQTVASALNHFADSEISREFGAGIDQWKAGDLTFRIISPPKKLPEDDGLKFATVPSVIAELTLDNSKGITDRKAFFGYAGSDRSVGMRIVREDGLLGVGQGTSIAIASNDKDIYAGIAWQPEVILNPVHEENLPFMLGSIGMLVGNVPAGETKTFRFAIAFFREGTVTTGLATKYLYRRYFDRIEDVLQYTLEHADETIDLARAFDAGLGQSLTSARKFMLAHSIRSYYGATELLQREDGSALWVVNEGEYRMINTFDLAIDQAFFELKYNPWTVKNVLDLYVERYSYEEQLRFWGSGELQPGGLTFTHDMGVSNTFSAEGYSSYEQAGLTGCFSYMSSEELMNWIITAGLYANHTGDTAWVQDNRDIFARCLASMQNRDHPVDAERNGVMSLDGNRCLGGAEITTYDSLDESLGQARNNLYLAVKGWATYLILENVLGRLGDTELAATSAIQARRAADTIIAAAETNGMMPAVIGEGYDARIIPAIEALVYPAVAGIDVSSYDDLVQAVKRHFEAIMKPGVCKFEDGGWKLSSTSNNSWLSKIYLCQYVAESILGYPQDHAADAAHVAWLLDDENAYFAWSDQMLSGKAVGSRYYPRGVTSILWDN